MKVKELIAQLSKFDQELDVVCYSEDEDLLAEGHRLRIMWPIGVALAEGRFVKGEDGIPSIALQNRATKLVTIEVTVDF